jgi:hypothetical protein
VERLDCSLLLELPKDLERQFWRDDTTLRYAESREYLERACWQACKSACCCMRISSTSEVM